ncbi:MAG: bifunctional proline dehydrogenase/L-glutamate gamma-semialdehyde dehydrogenase PutA [Gammaproteobacteria bacterium]|nr:bifunctional proline dehydrogenase/L-glutamate gamma-semialdehyde dehydrogenase PutA [Gammaproteobacteria bacterium]NIR83448.1 bifunctional proline dehydrogenase/L-glutamate gamma-semialdehyde dehydrogenase PutA [Gammaproteobacteria bacterium]NIR91370.1 bifunctional proline dehydrogenase/L-glutamate gamma-semialdehyde dehydrogenase PutA [Gammaproteobacteria bacterium]NIU04610.1 bifunctional proline dehydrogenase/L-glutamate gamma-semialdehyde dehydrogenase PutA [Gammaproteobacteria bacterium]
MIFSQPLPEHGPLYQAIIDHYRADETHVVDRLLHTIQWGPDAVERVTTMARDLVSRVREARVGKGGIDAFLNEYELSSEEGVVLMCLAEALLRIPDADTADRLIRDKLAHADWERHLGHSQSVFVNASTLALMLTGRFVSLQDFQGLSLGTILRRLMSRLGEPVIREAVNQAMRILGRQFVMGRTIQEALRRARDDEARGYVHSFDMLGEAARTAEDANTYLERYHSAVTTIGKYAGGRGPVDGPGISVKLSALHPRFEFAQRPRVMDALTSRLLELAQHARDAGIGLTVDAEEADRLEFTLDVLEAVSGDRSLAGWDGLGLAVQGYQKRAWPLIAWLAEMAQRHRRRLMVRLVKGAYWDTEIKRAQERGLDGYPVFTRKVCTDVSYLACAQRLLDHRDTLFPQFATHNAHTLAAVLEMAGNREDFEFQRLHGMGEALYAQVVGEDKLDVRCRVYAPVGSHEDLLPYLVRRLLENGANTSFVNRIIDQRAPVEDIVADPLSRVQRLDRIPHPRIPPPRDIYLPERLNARGVDLTDPAQLVPLARAMQGAAQQEWRAAPIVDGANRDGSGRSVVDPFDNRREVGRVQEATRADIEDALTRASGAAPGWDAAGGTERARCLERMAELLERDMAELMAVCVREGGKNIADSVAEVREAVDFCRYYAARARAEFAQPRELPGPTGEHNQLALHGRGVFACVSPWNFPLAIFTGQVTAALAAGNAVVAKPAEQTPLIAAQAVRLLHEAGVPPDVLHLLPGDGKSVGAALVGDPRVAGIAFTGSTETARAINGALAAQDGPIRPLIAETGGQNAMIVDSSALPEQVVADVLASAFQSAGQRCSALRVLFLQTHIADKVIHMLAGAMAELVIGDPGLLETDVGPVIDREAQAGLERHAERMRHDAKLVYECELPQTCAHGTFFAPRAYEIDGISRLEREIFGPILHIVRYESEHIDRVIDAINATGYGLTVGIHSRIDEAVQYIHRRLRVGNAYANRNQIGSVVGVHPFGGEGLSGTGPKAGGPHYLYRFATERTLSINTTAQGGNATLMSLQDEE